MWISYSRICHYRCHGIGNYDHWIPNHDHFLSDRNYSGHVHNWSLEHNHWNVYDNGKLLNHWIHFNYWKFYHHLPGG